jgi:hypothetical protein
MKFLSQTLPVCLFAGLLAGTAPVQAATVTLDFDSVISAPLSLDPDSPGIVGGNCDSASGPLCLGVNAVGAAVLTIASGLTFSVSEFWFKLLGEGDNMIVETDKGSITLLEADYDHNTAGGFILDTSALAIFQDITYLSWIMGGRNGNGRVDDIKVSYDDPAPIPLPAGGLLLAGGLLGLAALRRRKIAV